MKNANDYGCNNTYNIQNKCRRTFSQKTAKHYFRAFHAAFAPFQTCNHVLSRSFSPRLMTLLKYYFCLYYSTT